MTVNFVFDGTVSNKTRTNGNGTAYNWYGVRILGVTNGAEFARPIKSLLPLSVKQEQYVEVSDLSTVHTAEATEGTDGRINLQINMVFESTPLAIFGDLLSQTTQTPVEDAVSANGGDLPF